MFSVVIPAYNKAPYIEKAIESVLQQTLPDLELVIINDGSTDNSLEKIARFNDNRMRVFTQLNTGVSTARNNGVKLARFEHIAFLDADDWWDARFLETMKKLIHQFPEAGLYGSRYFIVKNGMNTPAQVGTEAGFEAGYIDYFNVYSRTFWVPINCSFMVVKKSVFEETGGFNPVLKFGEDLDLWIRMALIHPVGYVNKLLAYSNQDAETASRALGADKCWPPSAHMLFNLSYLVEYEQKLPDLKRLLDGLRVRSLEAYYLNNWYPQQVQSLLSQVDFSRQPLFYRFLYQWPKRIAIGFFRLKKLGSQGKQSLIRAYRRVRPHNYAIR